MRKFFLIFLILAGLAIALVATAAQAAPRAMALAAAPDPAPQTAAGHSIAFTWTASSDAAANPSLTYNLYQASTCTGTFAKVASAIAGTSYTLSGIQPGTYCYQLTAELNNAESVPSNQAPVVILPAPPTNFAGK